MYDVTTCLLSPVRDLQDSEIWIRRVIGEPTSIFGVTNGQPITKHTHIRTTIVEVMTLFRRNDKPWFAKNDDLRRSVGDLLFDIFDDNFRQQMTFPRQIKRPYITPAD